jgi:uncharacterized Fe-S cluster protein YjdI
LKDIRYFTNGEETVEWNQGLCMHFGKCLKLIPYSIDKPGVYSISVSDSQFRLILSLAKHCPAKALKLK